MAINFNTLQPFAKPQMIGQVASRPQQNTVGNLLQGLYQTKGHLERGATPSPLLMPMGQIPGVNVVNAPNPQQAAATQALPIEGLQLPNNPILAHTLAGIAHVESGGSKQPYKVVSISSPNGDKAYGKYQIMGNNIPAWTKEALGKSMTPQEFISDPAAQEKTAAFHVNRNLQKYKNIDDVASVWFSGRPAAKAGKSKDAYGTSVPEYINKFKQGYQNAAKANPQLAMNNEIYKGQADSDTTFTGAGNIFNTPYATPDSSMFRTPNMNQNRSMENNASQQEANPVFAMNDSYNRGYQSPYSNPNGFTTGAPQGPRSIYNPNDPFAPRPLAPVPQGPNEMAVNESPEHSGFFSKFNV